MPKKKKEKVPRFRFLFQDGQTGFQSAVGSDNIKDFTKTDLESFLMFCYDNIKKLEEGNLKVDEKKSGKRD